MGTTWTGGELGELVAVAHRLQCLLSAAHRVLRAMRAARHALPEEDSSQAACLSGEREREREAMDPVDSPLEPEKILRTSLRRLRLER